MISFKICLRIVSYSFAFFLIRSKKKAAKRHLFCSNKHLTGLAEELTCKSKGIEGFISAISCLHDLSARAERHPTRVFNHVNGGMSPTLALCFQVLRVMILTKLREECSN